MADRMARESRTVLALLTFSLLTAACANQQPGMPQAQEVSSASAAVDRHGAPPVTDPIDATRFLTQPCTALTNVQLQSLNLPGPGVPDLDSHTANYAGPSCSWRNSETQSSVGVSFMTGNKNGLADLYRGRAEGKLPGYWVETTVDGYPGVFASLVDSRKNGICALSVGISDSLQILVDQQDLTGEKSCDQATVTASLALKTMQGG
jgi:uncharacterized protein DUF3558